MAKRSEGKIAFGGGRGYIAARLKWGVDYLQRGRVIMSRNFRMWAAVAIVIAAAIVASPRLFAQFAKAPEVYTVVENNAMSGPGSTTAIYRDGSKAMIEITNGQGQKTRTVYDLETKTSVSWSAESAAAGGCGSGKFSGDWGDPFAGSADMTKDLSKPEVKLTGAETFNGFATKVYEVTGKTPAESAKVWVETKYGLVMKANLGSMGTFVEVKQFSVARPAASLFVVPTACTAAAAQPAMSPAQQIAADAGVKNPNDYTDAIMPPTAGGASSCAALFKIVRAGTMEPITNVRAIGVDTADQPGAYTVGGGANGSHFSGGTIKDMTAQYRNGILRIDNMPAHFMIDVEFTGNSSATALIYRQCVQPQSVLLLVVKNPNDMTDGKTRWLWSKSGK
jgi:hypothetical protein